LATDRTSISFASGEDTWVDVVEFEELAATSPDAPEALAAWQRATELWRGDFVEGLQPTASAEWEEWKLLTAEQCRRNLVAALRNIANRYEETGDLEGVAEAARRLIEAAPWDERGHRQLMQALASRGEHTLAIAHYSELARHFKAEHGTLPSPQTAALADQIRSGEADEARTAVAGIPSEWLSNIPADTAGSAFVGREQEMAALQTHLGGVRHGQGRFVLIAGEAGSGKTTLMAEFMRRATEVRTASGRCNAFGGLGDPYLPFREALSLLAGDVEAKLKMSALSLEQATSLWEGMPQVARLIAEHGPHLPGVMIDGVALVHRVAAVAMDAGWIQGLRNRVEAMTRLSDTSRVQPALFDEYTSVLTRAAEDSPIVLVIDDLQWADAGSIALLWHLVRRLDRMRVVLIGAYRPEEISPGTAESNALASLWSELSVQADLTIELGADRQFVDALVDAEPNELDDKFRRRLFSFTGGHALFTVEMLRSMQERGEIARDSSGAWLEQESLSWDTMPRRLEVAIERRIARFPAALLADLAAASVQGEQYLAEVAGAVRANPDALTRLHQHARSAGRVVEPAGVARIDDRPITRYHFRHSLFQHYFYGTLGDAEHVQLHEATARALEELYSSDPDPPVVDLAYHFDKAGLIEPSIDYLEQAARRARGMAANEESIRLLERAHELLQKLPALPNRDGREVELLVLLAAPVNIARGWGTPEAQRISDRIGQLIERVKPSTATALALIRFAGTYIVAGRFHEAQPWTKRSLVMADAIGNPTLRAATAFETGVCLTELGQSEAGHQSCRLAYEVDYNPDPDVVNAYGADPAAQALAYDASNALALGHPDQARVLAERGIEVARSHDHPFTLCLTLDNAADIRGMHGDHDAALDAVEELDQILAKHHFPYWTASLLRLRGILAGERGDYETGIGLIEGALTQFRAMGISAWRWQHLVPLAELHHQRGETDRALQVILEGEQEIDRIGEPVGAAVLSLERGRLLRLGGDEAAEKALLGALEATASIGHRGYELEAATELALLYEADGRKAAALEVLGPRYEGYDEGFGTTLLIGARQVLDRL
jgi:tetratricopeptide (TPR) repeat protein